MELDSSKKDALLFWFNTYGKSIELDMVDSLSSLWHAHVPSLLNCLCTDRNTKIISSSAATTYQDLYAHFQKANQENGVIVDSLSVEDAAEGNNLEIAKFLAVLLNEFRISKPDVITESVAVMERDGHDVPLKEILNALDEEHNEWWTVMTKRSASEKELHCTRCVTPHRYSLSAEEFSAMSVSRSSFITPCGPNRRRDTNAASCVQTIPRCDGSPLMDAINSPKVREMRRERELRSLRRELNELEDRLMQSEAHVSEYKMKIELLIEETARKQERIRHLESSSVLAQKAKEQSEDKVTMLSKQLEQCQRVCIEQKERLTAYKLNLEIFEEKQVELNEMLQGKDQSIAALERQLRDIKDESVETLQQLRIVENERSSLVRVLEEEKRIGSLEREQYNAAVSDWRKRLETETSDILSLYTIERDKNVLMQQEIREKTEKLEVLQCLYDREKRASENVIEETKKGLQKKLDVTMKRLADTETKLSQQEERHKCFVSEHEAVVQQLESIHLAEAIQRDSKINSASTRIEELETAINERDRTIRQQRKDLACIITEKEIIESSLASVQGALNNKEEEVNENIALIEKLKGNINVVTSKLNDTTRSQDSLQAKYLKLQSMVEQKDVEISGLKMRVEDLTSLSKVYDEAAHELKQTQQILEEERKRLRCENSDTKILIEDLKKELTVAKEKELESISFMRNREEEWRLKEQELEYCKAKVMDEVDQLSKRTCELEEELLREKYTTEELKSKFGKALDILEEKNRCHADSLSKMDNKIDELLRFSRASGESSQADFQQLQKNNTLKRDQLISLLEKFEILETELCNVGERNSRLELEVARLREENSIISKFMDNTSTMSISRVDSAKRLRSNIFSSKDNLVFLGNEEEPSFCELRTSDGRWVEVESNPAASLAIPSGRHTDEKSSQCCSTSNVSQCSSVSNLDDIVITESTPSLNKLNTSKRSLFQSSFSTKVKGSIGKDTDRSRLDELQKRNAMLHPVFRCAYATELTDYNSPSGNENVVKHGNQSERKRSGVKFFQRASSYVRRKLPLSETTNAGQQ